LSLTETFTLTSI